MTAERVPVGTIAYFVLGGCPQGWAFADGASGTMDLRGAFLRVWDNGKGVDPDRVLGKAQGDAIRNIKGQMQNVVSNSGLLVGGGVFADGRYVSSWNWGGNPGPYPYSNSVVFDASKVVPVANENRPYNIALITCQKL